MDCLKAKRETFEQKLDFLLGQSGGFSVVEHRIYSLAALCLQNKPNDSTTAKSKTKANNFSSSSNNKDKPSDVIPDKAENINNQIDRIPSSEHRDSEQNFKGNQDNDGYRTDSNALPSASSVSGKSSSRDNGSDFSGSGQQDSMAVDAMKHVTSVIKHFCDSQDSNCGCDLFVPKNELPAIFHQQTYSRWKSMLDMTWRFRMIRKKPVIYLQPLENFPEFVDIFQYSWRGEERTGFFTFLKDFLSLFFMGVDIRLMKTKLISEYGWKVKQRFHHKTNKEQLLVSDIYTNITTAIPKDGFCLLGVTWTDLYPSEELNFVLGEASNQHRTGVFCFGRFEPKAYIGDTPPPTIDRIHGDLIFRMIKLITHETCHIYGLAHCVFFDCSMNESTSMQQALDQPLFLCPVCLKKLQKACQFDLVQRYEAMLEFLDQINLHHPSSYISKAAAWLQQCLSYIRGSRKNPDSMVQTRL